jgi:CMP-N-acetylneuraminic acid synthetase
MRIAGFVPSKLNSERVPEKNIKALAGVPLVNYVLRTLNQVKSVDESIIFASEPRITEYIEKGLRYRFVRRPEYLDTQKAKVQDFISEFLKADNADIVVLLHITSPFIKPETVEDCVSRVASGEYDSAFAAVALKKFCWFKGKPLNYSLENPTPRTQDLEPVVVEQSGLYVFKRTLFEQHQQRLSAKAYIRTIDECEAHDIDTPEDFAMAELILKNKK